MTPAYRAAKYPLVLVSDAGIKSMKYFSNNEEHFVLNKNKYLLSWINLLIIYYLLLLYNQAFLIFFTRSICTLEKEIGPGLKVLNFWFINWWLFLFILVKEDTLLDMVHCMKEKVGLVHQVDIFLKLIKNIFFLCESREHVFWHMLKIKKE